MPGPMSTRTAKVRMVSHMRSVIDFLNRLDGELEEPDESKRVLFNLLDRTAYAAPWQISRSPRRFTYTAPLVRKPPQDTRVTIIKPKVQVERLRNYLGSRSNKAAVEAAFDWYMKNVCPDDG